MKETGHTILIEEQKSNDKDKSRQYKIIQYPGV